MHAMSSSRVPTSSRTPLEGSRQSSSARYTGADLRPAVGSSIQPHRASAIWKRTRCTIVFLSRTPRLVKKLVESLMPSTVFEVDVVLGLGLAAALRGFHDGPDGQPQARTEAGTPHCGCPAQRSASISPGEARTTPSPHAPLDSSP